MIKNPEKSIPTDPVGGDCRLHSDDNHPDTSRHDDVKTNENLWLAVIEPESDFEWLQRRVLARHVGPK